MARDDDMMTPGDDASDELVPTWTTDGHLDEGTIHAWLDDAFDASQAAVIAAHVDGCASCRESVAEARGFIAGASRMVRALDAVPSGVVPQADVARVASRIVAAASADGARVVSAPARAQRAWYTGSAVRAAAAVLVMVAGGSYVLSRNPVTQMRATDLRAIDSIAPTRVSAPVPASAAEKLAFQPVATPRTERRAMSAAASQAVPQVPPQAAPPVKSITAPGVATAADVMTADASRGKLMKDEAAQGSALAATRAPVPAAPPPPATANFAAKGTTARTMSAANVDSARRNERAASEVALPVIAKAEADRRSDRATAVSCWLLRTVDKGDSLGLPNGLATGEFATGVNVQVVWLDWPATGRSTRVEFTADGRGRLLASGSGEGKNLSLSLTRNSDGWMGTAVMRDEREFLARTSARVVTRTVMMTRAEPSVCKQ